MVTHADYDPPCNGLLNGYLERKDIENYSKSCASHLRRFNTVKNGVQQQDVELFEAANEWWRRSSMSSDRKASHPVEVPAWFALACYQKSQVWVEGMAEPVSMPDAMRQPE